MTRKKYIALALMVIYVALKVYVEMTPDHKDDDIPDKLRDIVLRLAFINPDSNGA